MTEFPIIESHVFELLMIEFLLVRYFSSVGNPYLSGL
jgi:hypothetical protein